MKEDPTMTLGDPRVKAERVIIRVCSGWTPKDGWVLGPMRWCHGQQQKFKPTNSTRGYGLEVVHVTAKGGKLEGASSCVKVIFLTISWACI